VSVPYVTLAMQMLIAFFLGLTFRLMWNNNRSAKISMSIITETMAVQAQTTNELIRRVFVLEQRIMELEDGRARPHK
jgi:hypothetical protein